LGISEQLVRLHAKSPINITVAFKAGHATKRTQAAFAHTAQVLVLRVTQALTRQENLSPRALALSSQTFALWETRTLWAAFNVKATLAAAATSGSQACTGSTCRRG